MKERIEMLEGRAENKFGFEAERLKVCSAAKRMFAVFSSTFQYWAQHLRNDFCLEDYLYFIKNVQKN